MNRRTGSSIARAAVLVCIALAAGAACRPRALTLPAGGGTPFPEAGGAYEAAVQGCRAVQTFEGTLALSGRAGSQGLRGNVDAGFEAPASARLEMRGPIGRPIFILAANGSGAVLYLPRDNRVLRHAQPAAIVEALVGLPIDAADLRAIVSGCGFGAEEPEGGRAFPGDWAAVETGDATTFLRRVGGRWLLAGATRPPLSLQYADFGVTGRPATLRLRAEGRSPADVTVRLSDVTINLPLAPGVFEVRVPPGTEPLTIEELRRAGPLGTP